MQEMTAIVGIAAALAIGAASPGPSFVMVARTAASSTRMNGLCAALGMGIGGAVFAVASLFGLHGLLLAVPSLYVVLKIGGGLYLAYLGVRIWQSAKQPLAADAAPHRGRSAGLLCSFTLGLATQLSNPKTAIVYASVFAAFLPASPSLAFDLAVVGLVFFVETAWYSLVAAALSSIGPRTAYLRFKAWIDRAAGSIMLGLGLKLVLSANRA
ncbi:MAG TPA: LysE family transporter [Burkholderiales bacterium]|nr:LysE family transporter [Burkholderiales bacterium]